MFEMLENPDVYLSECLNVSSEITRNFKGVWVKVYIKQSIHKTVLISNLHCVHDSFSEVT